MSTNKFNLIKEIILDINDEVELSTTTDLIEIEAFDSLETITFLNEIEEQFDLTISTDIYTDKKLYIIENLIIYLDNNNE